jgi:hypothetical protein
VSKQLLLIGIVLITAGIASDWELKKKSEGIEIYTRSIEGSSFDEFKGVTVLSDFTLNEVLNVILDVENYDVLFPNCINPKILKREGREYDIHYTQTKGPFPVKDRDSIFEQTTAIDQDGKHARITLKPLPDYLAENGNMVRIRKGTGFWDLREDNHRKVTVTFQFHGEPGGLIPSWLANSFVVYHPFNTLKNLRSMLN